ncbi:MAG: hypothetical protein KY476_06505 [Planctomycetes bacterium]|nr:hypothetical protein [Planctomycetota bacterium]
MLVPFKHRRPVGNIVVLLITTFGGTGLPLNAQGEEMQYPLSVAAAAEGPVYVADLNLPGIWKIEDGKPAIYFQGQKKFRTPLNAVRYVALDPEGRLLACDSATREVYRFDDEGQPKPLTGGRIGIPASLAFDTEGSIFVGDLELQRIWKVPAEGGEPQEFAVVTGARGLAFDAEGWLWVVSQGGEDQLLRISPDGKTIEPVAKGRPFEFPHHVVLDSESKTAWVTDNYAKAVWKVPRGAAPEKWVSGEPFVRPVGLARRGEKLLVADPHAKAIFEIDAEGKVTTLTSALTK